MEKVEIEDLKKFLESGYIQKGWLDNNYETLLNNDILECINNCTSPTGENPNEKLKAIFRAFSLFPMEETRILILGQDPYPDEKYPNKADGLAFSQNGQNPAVDSLKNIFEGIKNYKIENNIASKPICEWDNTNLKDWASKNKVLLLNTALTYKKGEEHFNIWRPFVIKIISNLIKIKKSNKGTLSIFLWGVPAQQLFYKCIKNTQDIKILENGKLIEKAIISFNNNRLYMTSHPCNRSKWRGFSNNIHKHFSDCDEFLSENIWKNFPENNK